MADSVYTLGGGVPPGWSVSNALNNRGQRPDRTEEKTLFSPMILVGQPNQVDPSKWTVRDQGARGTCNAFAIAAAEELVEANQSGDLCDLSEEFLYAYMRKDIFVHLEDIGVDVDKIDEEKILRAGGTFLLGGLRAIEEHGICEERIAIYDKNKKPVNYVLSEIPTGAARNARARQRPRSDFTHNITKEPTTGNGRFWVNNGDEVAVASILAEKIQQGIPVVATFAILGGIGKQAWFGRLARRRGLVRYPSDVNAAHLKPIGGHTVCLIGVIGDDSLSENPGWFLFRNSYGPNRFAHSAPENGLLSFKPAPGYGIISAEDVDRYCWEYMARSSVPDSLPSI